MDKIDIKNLSSEELEGRLKALGQAPYRARQIFKWLYKVGVKSFDEMTDLSVALREILKKNFRMTGLVMADSKRSSIDGTTKYLFKLEDDNTIETVFLPEASRGTICLSSQVGCKYACSFCASAPFGFVRNLAPSEILNEVIFVRNATPESSITNLVFMGIGEPMDNYDNVMNAIKIFNSRNAFNIGARRITLSTCGIVPGIKRLEREGLQIELSVSLHSADDKIRSRLLPINKKYPLSNLIGACKDYTRITNRVITFEYVLIKGVNSSKDDALKLARLLKPLKCKINTILYNPHTKGFGAGAYHPPSAFEAKLFVDILKKNGINATNRKSKGEDIDAGCGQLRISRL